MNDKKTVFFFSNKNSSVATGRLECNINLWKHKHNKHYEKQNKAT